MYTCIASLQCVLHQVFYNVHGVHVQMLVWPDSLSDFSHVRVYIGSSICKHVHRTVVGSVTMDL